MIDSLVNSVILRNGNINILYLDIFNASDGKEGIGRKIRLIILNLNKTVTKRCRQFRFIAKYSDLVPALD